MKMISQGEAKKALSKLESKEKRLQRLKKESQKGVETGMRTGLTMASAFGVGWLKGKYPDKTEIIGLDAGLVIGAGLTFASLMGWAGNQEVVFESLGNGALASYAVSEGFRLGGAKAA